ncbi:MAG TPA: hypothetical protein VM784_13665, partial [Actinomycetota bacterium]|nr:hypothetical protein [Actinomycetota bacterium]
MEAWFTGRLPDDWFEGAPEVAADRDEILVIGTLPDVELDDDVSDADRRAAREGRINRFRETTREHRIAIA